MNLFNSNPRIIIGGDWNSDINQIKKTLEDWDTLHFITELPKTQMTGTIKNRSGKELDHVFCSSEIKTITDIPNPNASDHIPVIG